MVKNLSLWFGLLMCLTGCTALLSPELQVRTADSSLVVKDYTTADFQMNITHNGEAKPVMIVHIQKSTEKLTINASSLLGISVFDCVLPQNTAPQCDVMNDAIPAQEIVNSMLLIFSDVSLRDSRHFTVKTTGMHKDIFFKDVPFITIRYQGDPWTSRAVLTHHLYGYTLGIKPMSVDGKAL